ncbi:hypothetical protein Ancab_004628 [Ancistrocladus abbreviatus]
MFGSPHFQSSRFQNLIPSLHLHGLSCFLPRRSSTFGFSFLLHPRYLTSFYYHVSRSALSDSSALLHSCKDLQTLKQIHGHLAVSSLHKQISIAPKLVALYADFGDFQSSVSVFRSLEEPNTKLWNLILKMYVYLGMFDLGVAVYKQMRQLGVKHDGFTLPLLNQAILMIGSDVVFGKIIHSVGIRVGFGLDLYFCNTLIEAYVKCGYISLAHRLFDEMCLRDLVSWTSIISGNVTDGNTVLAIDLFGKMRTELQPNSVTMIIVLRGCSASGSAVLGK